MPRKFTNSVLLACSSLIAVAACEDGDSLPESATMLDAGPTADDAGAMQAVTLRFKAKLGDADLVCGKNYAGQGSTQREATPQDFRFFVQEAYLIDTAGNEVRVEFDDGLPFQTKDVALIDFTNEQGACSIAGKVSNLEIKGKVPAGSYNGVVFVNGVPESLNHANPALAADPLNKNAPGANWEWTQGYRFIMAELAPPLATTPSAMDAGIAPPVPADAGVDDAGVGARPSSIHVGSTACTGLPGSTITCAKANRNRVRLPSFNPDTQSIVADLSVVFAGVDLSAGSQCHGTGSTCVNAYASLGIDAEGKPAAAQQVFRVE